MDKNIFNYTYKYKYIYIFLYINIFHTNIFIYIYLFIYKYTFKNIYKYGQIFINIHENKEMIGLLEGNIS